MSSKYLSISSDTRPTAGAKRQLIDLVRLVVHPRLVSSRRIVWKLHIILLRCNLPQQGETAGTAE